MTKYASVLFVGTTWDDGKRRQAALRQVLHEMDPRWSLKADVAPTFAAARGTISRHEELDIVYVANESSRLPMETLRQRCEELADVLVRHDGKPWVAFNDDSALDPLVLLFEGRGIRVERDSLENVVHDRWAETEKAEEHQIAVA